MTHSVPVSHSLLSAEGLALVAARAYDLPGPVHCALLSPGINDTYQVTAGGQAAILRVYRAGLRSLPDIQWELDLLHDLARSGAPVSAPIPAKDGSLYLDLQAPEGVRQAALFAHASGKVLAYEPEVARRYGRAAAELHGAMDTFASDLPRFRLDLAHLLEEPLQAIRPYAEQAGHWQFYTDTADRLRPQIAAVAGELEQSICHGDLHGHNVHQDEQGRLTFFDFDCGGPGFRAYDLAVYRWAVGLHAKDTAPWEAFLEGYREVREVRQPDLDAIPLFVQIRTIWLLGLEARLVSRRGTDWMMRGIEWGVSKLKQA